MEICGNIFNIRSFATWLSLRKPEKSFIEPDSLLYYVIIIMYYILQRQIFIQAEIQAETPQNLYWVEFELVHKQTRSFKRIVTAKNTANECNVSCSRAKKCS